MRRAGFVAVAVFGLVFVTAHVANAADQIRVTEGLDGSTIAYDASGGRPGTAASAGAGASPLVAKTLGSAPPQYPVYLPQVIVVNGRPCLSKTVVYVSSQAQADSMASAYERPTMQLQAQWGSCPAAPAAPAQQGLAPAAVAAQFWSNEGQNPLLRPDPQIRPGYAVTGKTAYLETGGRTTQVFSDPTGAGVLQIQANGQFWVDWGDESGVQGPYDNAGAPYPDGTITHTWSDTGSYTVTVYETWSATWSLAGQSGTLAGLRTVGRINGFPVKELVSVRNR